jgi:Flp pilus assembly protein TadG
MPVLKLKRFGHRYGEKKERGQSMVEFVLVVPIFLVLVFGIVDFGMGIHAWLTITSASREGARIGSVSASAAEIEAKVRSNTTSLDQSQLTVVTTNAQGTSGDSVVVDVDYHYDFITPLSSVLNLVGGSAIGTSLEFSSTTEMRLE